MERQKRSFKEDNRGLTLIELLCSITIFACITAVIGSVLVVTAKTYQGGTTESALQQEAQLAVNIIEGLVVDAKDSINYYYYNASGPQQIDAEKNVPSGHESTNRMLRIADDANNRTDIIFEASTNRLLYQKTVAGTAGTQYVLAENVSSFGTDLSKFTESNNVILDIELEKDSRTFDAEYTVTTRNSEVTTTPYTPGKWATISCDAEITLEPNQIYTLPVTVDASSNVTNKNFTYTLENGPNSSVITDGAGIKISVGADEQGGAYNSMYLIIKTVETFDGSTTPLAQKIVNIKIRRVDDIDVAFTSSGGDFSAGSVYTVESTLGATPYLYQEVNEIGTYVNPCDVDWTYQLSGGGVNESGSATGTTSRFIFTEVQGTAITPASLNIKLVTSMPTGSTLTITGKATHPAGANKKGTPYVAYEIKDSATISNMWVRDDLFKRGQDYTFASGATVSYPTEITQDQKNKARWFWRYREIIGTNTYGSWSEYRKTCENSISTLKINAHETRYLAPDKAYEVEFIPVIYEKTGDGSTGTIYWPYDASLISASTGFGGYTKGWTTTDVTSPSEYAVRYSIGRTKVKFHANSAYGVSYGDTHIGTSASPLAFNSSSSDFTVQVYTTNMEFGHFQSTFLWKLEKYNSSSGAWESVSPSGYQYDFTNGKAEIKNVSASAVSGKYRLKSYMSGFQMYRQGGTVAVPEEVVDTTLPYDMYDEATGEGIIYFTLN